MNITVDKKFNLAMQRLNRMSLPEVTAPFRLSPLFFHFIDSELNSNMISSKNHFHTYYEVHFSVGGNIRYTIDGCETVNTLDSNDFLLISPSVKHQLITDGKFQKIGIGFYLSQNENNEYSVYLNKLFSKRKVFFGRQTENMRRCFQFVLTECTFPNFYTPYFISQMIMKIVVEMFLCMEPGNQMFQYQTVLKDDQRLALAKKFIMDNKHLNLVSKNVANHVYISIKQLNRIFMTNESMTVQQYISSVKFKEARRLLCDTDIPVKHIRHMLGFGSESYFNVFFRKYTNFAPGEYRKRFGNISEKDRKDNIN